MYREGMTKPEAKKLRDDRRTIRKEQKEFENYLNNLFPTPNWDKMNRELAKLHGSSGKMISRRPRRIQDGRFKNKLGDMGVMFNSPKNPY